MAQTLGDHELGGIDHHRHDTGGATVIVGNRAVVEIQPDVFRYAVAQQHQFLVAIRQGAARQAGINHVAIEFGNFRPTQLHRGTQQVRMTPAGKLRVGVVIDHVAGPAPEHHHWQR
ncbi:hypothetical protein D3C84_831050 [compost metagenome]